MTVKLEWDNKGLLDLLDTLSPDSQAKIHKDALAKSLKEVTKVAQASASAAGYSSTGEQEKNGWQWARYGRVLRSISAGKVWKGKTFITGRVFNKGGKRQPFLKSAPHAHLAILGHKKYVPIGNGQSGKGSVRSAGFTPGVGFYEKANQKAGGIFEREVIKSVQRMINRINKKAGP